MFDFLKIKKISLLLLQFRVVGLICLEITYVLFVIIYTEIHNSLSVINILSYEINLGRLVKFDSKIHYTINKLLCNQFPTA